MVYNPRTRKKERVGRLLKIKADEHIDVETCYAGDIAAIVGIKNVTTGDTLCDAKFDILLEPPSFPEPVIAMAVEPKTKADQDKLSLGLSRLSEEDPTFVVKTDEETAQTIIAGMGELHLEVIIDRLKREFSVMANTGKPQIAYRETITADAGGEGILKKQTGGSGQYGHVILDVVPLERGKGTSWESTVTGGSIPKDFINAVFSGVQDSFMNGTVAGFPVVDLHVTVKDGSYHDVDSNENAFKMAAIFAMRDALLKASPVLLEPVMDVEIATPEEYQGDIMGDLNRRRAQIGAIETKGKDCAVKAMVPLAEMFGYMTDLRTISSGRASFTMEPSSFEEVMNQKIRIRLRAYDHQAIDRSALEIVETAKRTGAKIAGPVPLPTRIEKFSVNRSVNQNKKSAEQFEIRTHKRLLDIMDPTAMTVDELKKLNLPAGVDISISI